MATLLDWLADDTRLTDELAPELHRIEAAARLHIGDLTTWRRDPSTIALVRSLTSLTLSHPQLRRLTLAKLLRPECVVRASSARDLLVRELQH